ncbi:MAG: penicillin-binding protein 1A [Cyanobacteria bacterium J06641_5]
MSASTFSAASKPTRRKSPPQPPAIGFARGVVRIAGGTILCCSLVGVSVVAGGLVGLALGFRNLPDIRAIRDYAPPETSYIYDINGTLLTSLHGEIHREVVPSDKISPELKAAVLAIEDSHFYQHDGINFVSIGRAVLANAKAGAVREGASTLTMQLTKNLFLSTDRTVSRKLSEAVLAMRIEQVLEKDEILDLYLNTIYWGHNAYGAETAAQSYFQKSASELNLAEASAMAGLIQAPEQYSPFINYDETKRRQALVLDRMATLGWITPEEAEEARKTPLLVGKPTAWRRSISPYITDAAIAEVSKLFGREVLYEGGLRIQTTVDLKMQQLAEESVKESYLYLRHTADQIALAAVDPRTHFVKALVGGVDYQKNQFNRATQARRQPGSSFKPFVYYAAFATGKYTPASVVTDVPVRYRDGSAFYEPKNYGGGFSGAVSLRSSLISSLNIPAVKLGLNVGLNNVVALVKSLDVKSPMIPAISLPLGSVGMTPLEMAGAYATFANNGWHSQTTLIARITDREGNVLLDNTPKPVRLLDQWSVATTNNLMQAVIYEGTGKRAGIGRPAAGKTGTTNSERDVWFVGHVPQLATAVWVGNDDNRPMRRGTSGGTHAAPVWRNFMRKALANEPVKQFLPASKFKKPQPQ